MEFKTISLKRRPSLDRIRDAQIPRKFLQHCTIGRCFDGVFFGTDFKGETFSILRPVGIFGKTIFAADTRSRRANSVQLKTDEFPIKNDNHNARPVCAIANVRSGLLQLPSLETSRGRVH